MDPCILDGSSQVSCHQVLEDVRRCAERRRLGGDLRIYSGRENYYFDLGARSFDLSAGVESCATRHRQVKNDDIRLQGSDGLE